MEGEVYADLYFLINAGMDLIGLMITAACLHRKANSWRLLLGAAFGGAYALLHLLLGFAGFFSFVSDLVAAVLLCGIAFARRRCGFGALLRTAVVYLLISMILGGVMTALYTWLNRLELPLELLEGDGISVWIFSALAAFAGLTTAFGGKFLGRAKRTKTVEIEAHLFGKVLQITALTDTGNLLRDPVSGRGVILVREECLRGILPAVFFSSASEEERSVWMHRAGNASRIRPIPAKGATGDRLLWATVPDRLLLRDGREELLSDYLIAPAELSGAAEGFDGLIAWD